MMLLEKLNFFYLKNVLKYAYVIIQACASTHLTIMVDKSVVRQGKLSKGVVWLYIYIYIYIYAYTYTYVYNW